MFHGTLGGKILLIIILSITIQLSISIYYQHIYICRLHLDIFSTVSNHTCFKGVIKPPHVASYIHLFYRTKVWYLRQRRKIVTKHNWVQTIYHHKLLVTYFDRRVFYTLSHDLVQINNISPLIHIHWFCHYYYTILSLSYLIMIHMISKV